MREAQSDPEWEALRGSGTAVPETTIKLNPAATLSGTASERVPSGHFRPQAESEREVGLEASADHDSGSRDDRKPKTPLGGKRSARFLAE